MFFKRHIKQGEEIGRQVNSLLKSAVANSNLHKNLLESFSPPASFFSDSYICGFIHCFVNYSINWGLGGETWSANKKGECVKSALSTIDPTGMLGRSLTGEIENDQKLYLQGANDGAIVIGLIYGNLKPNHPDPKVSAAINLAKSITKSGSTAEDLGSLGAAASIVTIRDYISRKWG